MSKNKNDIYFLSYNFFALSFRRCPTTLFIIFYKTYTNVVSLF
jgi:hypothetical protein